MVWATLLATLAGGVLGVGSTLLVDQVRWQRDRRQQWERTRGEAYADFLTELSKSYESLWALGRGEYLEDQPRPAAARQILRTGGIYHARQRLVILAPLPVQTACERVFTDLKAVRDIIASDEGPESRTFREADRAFRASLRDFHTQIRQDLGISAAGKVAEPASPR